MKPGSSRHLSQTADGTPPRHLGAAIIRSAQLVHDDDDLRQRRTDSSLAPPPIGCSPSGRGRRTPRQSSYVTGRVISADRPAQGSGRLLRVQSPPGPADGRCRYIRRAPPPWDRPSEASPPTGRGLITDRLMIMVLMQTDFPRAGCACDEQMGHFCQVRHHRPGPLMSRPHRRRPGLDLWCFTKASDSSTSRRGTPPAFLLVRHLNAHCRFSRDRRLDPDIRRCKAQLDIVRTDPRYWLTFTPCSGVSSYRVTDGPQLMSWTLTPLKFRRVCSSLRAVSFSSSSPAALSSAFPLQ